MCARSSAPNSTTPSYVSMRCRSCATLRLGKRPDSSVDDRALAEQVIRVVEQQHRIRGLGRLEQRVEILLGVAHVLADDALRGRSRTGPPTARARTAAPRAACSCPDGPVNNTRKPARRRRSGCLRPWRAAWPAGGRAPGAIVRRASVESPPGKLRFEHRPPAGLRPACGILCRSDESHRPSARRPPAARRACPPPRKRGARRGQRLEPRVQLVDEVSRQVAALGIRIDALGHEHRAASTARP